MLFVTLFVALAQGLNQTANIVKGFALAVGVVVAIGFVWMWWAHRVKEQRTALAARAKSIYASHLLTAVQHPELAEPFLGTLDNPVEIVRYKLHVAHLLATADEVLLIEPSAAWRQTLTRQLAPHASYLTSEEFRSAGLADCTPEVTRLIEQLRHRGAPGKT